MRGKHTVWIAGFCLALIYAGWKFNGKSEPVSTSPETIASTALPAQTPGSPRPVEANRGFVSEALEVVPLTALEAAQASSRIVLAEVVASTVREFRGNIFTFTDFKVIDTVKGAMPGTNFTIRVMGGKLGDVEVTSPITVNFAKDAKFVLFLGEDNLDGYPTIIPQALFRVLVSPLDRSEVVEPMPAGLELLNERTKQAYSAPPAYLSLADFLFSLRSANLNK